MARVRNTQQAAATGSRADKAHVLVPGSAPDHADGAPGDASSRDVLAAMADDAGLRRIHFVAWRDLDDPEAGGSELHAHRIASLWAEAGIDHEYMLFPDEGHGFAKPENRIKFYAAAERFLALYLGGRFEE